MYRVCKSQCGLLYSIYMGLHNGGKRIEGDPNTYPIHSANSNWLIEISVFWLVNKFIIQSIAVRW